MGWLFALFVLVMIGAGLGGMWAYATYTAPGPLKEATIINFPRGTETNVISRMLADKGVITNPIVMSVAALTQNLRGATLKPGEYEFPPGASMAEVFNIMASGRVVTYKLTVPEGWTSEMAVNRMREHEAMTGEIAAIPPEGTVIANTYLFARGKDRQQLLNDMMAAQAKLVESVWQRRPADSPIKSKEELVTLASIVEKETAKPEERPRVAAVFLNRLKANMRLQSDPTIIYGLVGGKGKLDRPISAQDIDSDTPYNTYRINGLPPGPIASPGKESLEAVINPATTNELYFVADGTGGHVFAETLEQHNENVRKWRAIEAGASAPATPTVQSGQADGAAAAAATEATPAQQPQAQLPNVAEEAPAAAAAVAAAPAVAPEAPATTQEADGTTSPEPDAAAAAAAPKPGSFTKVGKVLVPIPKLKGANP